LRDHQPKFVGLIPGSPFIEALIRGLSTSVKVKAIRSFPWSGGNSIEDRQSAALGLASLLDESAASEPTIPHFVIAHSHGGNIALAARQMMSRAAAANVQIITMATPFLSVRQPKPGRKDRLLALCLSIGLVMLAGYLTYLFLPFAVVLLGLPYYLSKVSRSLYGVGQSVPIIPQHMKNLKIIRGHRDEASLALLVGRVASSMAHIAGSISIIVPIMAAILSSLLLFDVFLFLLSLY
jgi:hypothetical protein